MKTQALLFLFAFILGCGQQNKMTTTYNHPQKPEIQTALNEMLKQPTNGFLIIEDSKTKKFIQFYNENGLILIDLPKIALTKDEYPLAKKYFSKCGINLKQVESKDPETGKHFICSSWTKASPPDQINNTINIALGALFEIYALTETNSLHLIKGWK
jgi:hypothetical protein